MAFRPPKRTRRPPPAPRGHGLARCLSKLGFASRADAARLVAAGRVTVGGRVIRDPDRRTDPARETIAVDNRPVRAVQPIYLAMHKPVGPITTWSDERGRRTVYDLLPPLASWVFPVGRLDAETSGLLLFTNDTRVGEALTGARYRVEKRYEVLARGVLAEEDIARLRAGIEIAGEGGERLRTLPARCEVLERRPGATRLSLAIREGKNRQVRRMLAALGHPVLALHRTHVGPVALGALAPGATRPLTAEEVRALRALAARARPS
jgi:23S rRNA pseudouridine2605 synthase